MCGQFSLLRYRSGEVLRKNSDSRGKLHHLVLARIGRVIGTRKYINKVQSGYTDVTNAQVISFRGE